MIATFILSVLSLLSPVLYFSGPMSALVLSIPAPVIAAIVFPIVLFIVDHLKLEVDPTAEALSVAQCAIRTLLHKAQANSSRLLAAEDALKDAQQTIDKLKAQNAIIESSNHNLLWRCSEQDNTIAAVIDERNSALAIWTQDSTHLQERTIELEFLYISAYNAKSALESKNTALLAQLGEVQSGVSVLAQENAHLTEDNNNMKELLDNIVQQNFVSERRNQVLQGEVKDLRLENAVLVKEKEVDSERRRHTIQYLELTIADKTTEIKRLSTRVQESGKVKEHLRHNIKNLELTVADKATEIKRLSTRVQESGKVNEHLRHNIKSLELTVADKATEIKRLSTRVQESGKVNEHLRHNIKNLELTVADKEATIEALTASAVTDDQVELQLKNTFAMLDDLLASAASIDSDVCHSAFSDSDSDSDSNESLAVPSLSTTSAYSNDVDSDGDDGDFVCTPFPPRRTSFASSLRLGPQRCKRDLRWTALVGEAIRTDEAINGYTPIEGEEL